MTRHVASHEVFEGALVFWMHVPRGGYGFTLPVEAKVLTLNPAGTRAKIEVTTKTGRKVQRIVDTENLRWR